MPGDSRRSHRVGDEGLDSVDGEFAPFLADREAYLAFPVAGDTVGLGLIGTARLGALGGNNDHGHSLPSMLGG